MPDEIKKESENNEEEISIEENTDGESFSFQEKLKDLQEKLKKCRKEKEEYLDGWQRAKADLINARKDDERRNQEFLKFANASLILDLLVVLDSFDLAFSKELDQKSHKGFLLIKMQIEDILKKYGLEQIKSIGEKIDLRLHEIIGEEISEKKEGVIIEEVQKGYLLYGKVIRPARVKITKSK